MRYQSGWVSWRGCWRVRGWGGPGTCCSARSGRSTRFTGSCSSTVTMSHFSHRLTNDYTVLHFVSFIAYINIICKNALNAHFFVRNIKNIHSQSVTKKEYLKQLLSTFYLRFKNTLLMDKKCKVFENFLFCRYVID